MKEFISKKSSPEKEDIGIRVTDHYIEVEFPCDETDSIYTYIVRLNDTTVMVLAALDNSIIDFLSKIDEDNQEIIFETWTVFGELYHNGTIDKYSEGALYINEDYDNGDKTAFVSTIVGNLNLKPIKKGLFGRKKINLFTPELFEAIKLVTSKSEELYQDLVTHELKIPEPVTTYYPNNSFMERHADTFLDAAIKIGGAIFETWLYS